VAITHVDAIRNTVADVVVDAIDVGSADANGDMQIATSSGFTTILSTVQFSNPAFGDATGGIATANAIAADTSAANTGTPTYFRVRDRDNAEIFRGTVTLTGGGGDMQLSSTNIVAGDTVTITSMTYTAAT
jgi:hypothetical protein